MIRLSQTAYLADYFYRLTNGLDEEDDTSDEEENGGPSDPKKAKKMKKSDVIKALAEEDDDDDDDEEMSEDDAEAAAALKAIMKGKGKASDEDEDDDDELDDEDGHEMEEIVVCTLDPEKVCCGPKGLTLEVQAVKCCTRLSARVKWASRNTNLSFSTELSTSP